MKKKKLEFIENENGCFIVTSHQSNGDGYCYIFQNHQQLRAHRYIYQECFGEIPNGLVVRHKCDTRNCINPEHMELGTHQDNMKDATIRGRRAVGGNTGINKITDKTAKEIKTMLKDGIKTCDIVRSLNVSANIVSSIRKRRTWKHVAI